MIIKQLKEKMRQFREAIYQSIEYRADAVMDLLDAISSNSNAKSVVELSLNPMYQRKYSSIEKSISELSVSSIIADEKEQRLKLEESHLAIISKNLPTLQERSYHLFASDVTPQPRPFARTLSDRKVVHSPNPTLSNKPIAVGHEYSCLVYLPEKASPLSPPWVVPLSVRRVSSAESGVMVATSQITALMTNPQLAFANELCLHVGDGAYSSVSYIYANTQHDNLVSVARLRSNRKLYFQPQELPTTDKGHPLWYGKVLKLKNANHYPASQEINTTYISRNGHTFNIRIKAWDNLLMRGKRDYPMHDQPLTLIRIDAFKPNGKSYYRRPLFLIVGGKRRAEISIVDIWLAYAQRYDIEHYFRFSKQRLLMSSFQTPDSQHEENWWHITLLAYCQLYFAAPLACHLPRPWEAKSLSSSSSLLSPSTVQRDFVRIIKEIGSPAKSPKNRGISLGRLIGTKLLPRIPLKVVFKPKHSLIISASLF
jgi:hypothetical protein